MFILPYALSIAAYVWAVKRAWRVQNKTARIVALVILSLGIAYTVYRAVTTGGRAYSENLFEFIILIVNVFVLFFASVAMALGEPEK